LCAPITFGVIFGQIPIQFHFHYVHVVLCCGSPSLLCPLSHTRTTIQRTSPNPAIGRLINYFHRSANTFHKSSHRTAAAAPVIWLKYKFSIH
jgi:hypothetical protein